MSQVLIVGGGLAGAVIARELAAAGKRALIVESSGAIGGKVRGYGCKATDKCNNCGVCLTKGLWDYVENSSLIDIRLNSKLADLFAAGGAYSAALTSAGVVSYIAGVSNVVIATGFEGTPPGGYSGFVEIESAGGHLLTDGPMRSGGPLPTGSPIMTGSIVESIMKERSCVRLFDKAPGKVAFIQCYGSRDVKENAMYCSRVCCAYSSRAAKVIKDYYPDCEITFFYMEMQQVKRGDYFSELRQSGIRFIKCRPVKITVDDRAHVTFDDPETGRREELSFDILVLSDGIRPCGDAAKIADICGLGQTEPGFLKHVAGIGGKNCGGIYLAGCVKGPLKIEETYSDSISAAGKILVKEKGV